MGPWHNDYNVFMTASWYFFVEYNTAQFTTEKIKDSNLSTELYHSNKQDFIFFIFVFHSICVLGYWRNNATIIL